MAIKRENLWSLETYTKQRDAFRAEVIAHKKNRSVSLGNHVRLLFEDEMTVRYQVQEMLRIEKIFEEQGIQDELDAYNALVPEGSNLKATVLIEYPDPEQRKQALAKLIDIEDHLYIQVMDQPKVYAIADEDLERENDEKTSAVHFARFEFTPAMKVALKNGAQMAIGCDHENYSAIVPSLPDSILNALVMDLKDEG